MREWTGVLWDSRVGLCLITNHSQLHSEGMNLIVVTKIKIQHGQHAGSNLLVCLLRACKIAGYETAGLDPFSVKSRHCHVRIVNLASNSSKLRSGVNLLLLTWTGNSLVRLFSKMLFQVGGLVMTHYEVARKVRTSHHRKGAARRLSWDTGWGRHLASIFTLFSREEAFGETLRWCIFRIWRQPCGHFWKQTRDPVGGKPQEKRNMKPHAPLLAISVRMTGATYEPMAKPNRSDGQSRERNVRAGVCV